MQKLITKELSLAQSSRLLYFVEKNAQVIEIDSIKLVDPKKISFVLYISAGRLEKGAWLELLWNIGEKVMRVDEMPMTSEAICKAGEKMGQQAAKVIDVLREEQSKPHKPYKSKGGSMSVFGPEE